MFTEVDASSDKLINLTKPKEKVKTVFSSEITNVKNQIVKLSITENVIVQNRTKQKENVFRNTGLSDKIAQDTTDLRQQNKPNLSAKVNVDNNQNKAPKHASIIDASDLDIRRLNMTDNNQEKPRDAIKVSGITKLNDQFNLEEELERFCIKNSVMEKRIKIRLDEWICRLSQTMEGALTDILLHEKTKVKRINPPKNPFFEAIQGAWEVFNKRKNIKLIINQFPMNLISCNFNNGKFKKDITPNEFMKLLGFCMILIEQLKEIVNSRELYKAEEMLESLIKNIEDPKTDIELSLEKINTPIFSRSEIEEPKIEIGFRKSRTEVLEYLKKHFAAWQCEDTADVDEPNILITSGKNLNTLKINNTRAITVEKVDSAFNATNSENTVILNVNQPKVIRNVKIIDAYEERIKKHAEMELDDLDYEDDVYTVSYITEVKSEKPDEYEVIDDLSVSESEGTECIRACPLARMFLVKLKSTLLQIFKFIKTSTQEYEEGMSADRQADMKWKTELTRNYLLKIAERLENIIARESGNGTTLKHLLIKSGDYVEEDAVMSNYKETIAKFLEQIHILEGILQYLLSHSDAASPKGSDRSYSILVRSPILPSGKQKKVLPTNTNIIDLCNT